MPRIRILKQPVGTTAGREGVSNGGRSVGIHARDLLTICIKSVAAVTVALIFALAVCVFAPPSYKSTAVLLGNPGKYVQSDANDAYTTLAVFARQEQRMNSMVELLTSAEVIGRSVDKFGIDRLFPRLRSDMRETPKFAQNARIILKIGWKWAGSPTRSPGASTPRDEAILRVSKKIEATAQPRTDLISVSFSHQDPRVAAEFTNTLLDAVRLRIMELYSRSGADAFFSGERIKYNQAFETSADRLSEFAITNNAYSIDEQRKLTLGRRNELIAEAAKTRSSIVEKESQASATALEITNLKPIAQYPQVRALVQDVPQKAPPSASVRLPKTPDAASTPPLLLVKVYQAAVQSIVQLKSEISGLQALESHQREELTKVDRELQTLVKNEAKFDRLKLDVDQAKVDAQQYSSLAAKEHLSAEVNKQGLSTIEVAQPAVAATRPSFPNPYLILPIGVGAGLLIGFLIPLTQLIAKRILSLESEADQLDGVQRAASLHRRRFAASGL
jgi:polysaccharide biosynthesis transport protein